MATSTTSSMPVKAVDSPLPMEKPQAGRRRVMLIADPCRESAGALQWALSHAVLEHDEIILLHVETPSSSSRRLGGGGGFSTYFRRQSMGSMGPSSSFGSSSVSSATSSSSSMLSGVGGGGGEVDFLEGMRAECEKAQPKVRVQIERVEMDAGKDKAAVILAQTSVFRADLLVIGQRRISSILGCKLGGSITGKPDTAEYLIEKSKCLCVGVQKKGQNSGYLLNTKTHKNFWLLA